MHSCLFYSQDKNILGYSVILCGGFPWEWVSSNSASTHDVIFNDALITKKVVLYIVIVLLKMCCVWWSSHCAISCRYTYGKPVVGAVKAEFCRYALRYYWRSGTQNKDICKTYELTVSIPNKNTFTFCKFANFFRFLTNVFRNSFIWFSPLFFLSSRRIKLVVLHKL